MFTILSVVDDLKTETSLTKDFTLNLSPMNNSVRSCRTGPTHGQNKFSAKNEEMAFQGGFPHFLSLEKENLQLAKV